MVDYLTYNNNTSHSIKNMHGGVLNLPQQYQPLYKQHAWWSTSPTTTIPTTLYTTCMVESTMHVVNRGAGIVVVG
jgi:hypothetical protein